MEKDLAVKRGSHVLAEVTFKDYLSEELLNMVTHKYWIVLPYGVVQRHAKLKDCASRGGTSKGTEALAHYRLLLEQCQSALGGVGTH